MFMDNLGYVFEFVLNHCAPLKINIDLAELYVLEPLAKTFYLRIKSLPLD